jgi:hypothetical protein
MSSTTVQPPRVTPGVEMAALVVELAAVAARMAELVSGGVMGGVPVQVATGWTEDLLRTADRVSAVASAGVGVVDAATDLIAGRYVSPRRWIEHTTHTSGSQAAAVVALARDVTGDYGRVGRARLGGDISQAAARELTLGVRRALGAVAGPRRASERDQVLDMLLPLARKESVSDVHRLVTRLRFVLDPDGATQAAMDAYDDQALRVSVTGPMAQVSMWTTAETAAALLTVLDQQISSRFRDGSLTADEPRDPTRAPRGDGPGCVDPAHRIPSGAGGPARHRREHLLALAFGETVTGLLDRGLVGNRHGVAAHLTLVVDADRYAAGLGGDLLVPGVDDAVPLTSATIGRILCDADVTAAVTLGDGGGGCPRPPGLLSLLRDAARTVLYLGRSERTVPPRLRRALELRDQHCAFPGCRVDVSRTHAHHVAEWLRDNGSTDIDNLVLLCSRHHHAVHEGGWTISPAPGGGPHTTSCWQFAPPPRPRP